MGERWAGRGGKGGGGEVGGRGTQGSGWEGEGRSVESSVRGAGAPEVPGGGEDGAVCTQVVGVAGVSRWLLVQGEVAYCMNMTQEVLDVPRRGRVERCMLPVTARVRAEA